jgi:membrane-associated phospholipid phosphatase
LRFLQFLEKNNNFAKNIILKEITATFRESKLYFILYIIVFLIATAVLSNINHGEETIFFSNRHTEFWDNFFTFCNRLGEPYAYGALVLILLFYRFGYSVLIPMIGIVVGLVSEILKVSFRELRPYNFFNDAGRIAELNFVEGVKIFQDFTSFPSGHTMSAFAIYGFLAFLCHKNKYLQVFFIILATLVGFSRMYLLQHFLNDVIAGSLVGTYIAMVFYFLHVKFRKNTGWMSRKISI